MANVISNVFKEELLKGNHDFDGGATYKLALFTSSKTVSASDPTAFNTTNEVSASGTNYTSGGATLTSVTPVASSTTAICDFADVSYTNASFTANGALIYNDTATGDPACVVVAFGSDKTVTSGTFTIQFPTADATDAIIRIA